MNTTLTFDEFVFPRRQRSLILLTMLLVFTLCWLPLNLINIAEDFNYDLHCWRGYNLTFLSCHAFAMSSTCYNPLLYWWLNQTFRYQEH